MFLRNYGIEYIVICLVGNISIICCIHWICVTSIRKTGIFTSIEEKIKTYLTELTDAQLLEYPSDCDYCRFTLILAQFRHLHSHMGMIMGFIIDDTGLWPRVLGWKTPFRQPVMINIYD